MALEYAERITYTDQQVDDALFARAEEALHRRADRRADGGHRHGKLPLEVQSDRSASRPRASAWCRPRLAGEDEAGRRAVGEKAGRSGRSGVLRPCRCGAPPRSRSLGLIGPTSGRIGRTKENLNSSVVDPNPFDRRPGPRAPCSCRAGCREAAMHGAGRIEMLAWRSGDDPGRRCLDDVVAQRPRHAVQRHGRSPTLARIPARPGSLGVGVHDAIALYACVLIHGVT